jgi:hypothetical protein
MASEEILISRVYLKPKAFWKSGMHTHYTSLGATPGTPIGEAPLQKIEYWFGVARGLPKSLYDIGVADGIATTDRPARRGEDEER